MQSHPIVAREQWIEARRQLLAKEKELTRLRDQLSQARRDLPWERVDKTYAFVGPNGTETLAQLFAGASQLVVYHFMFDPAWQAGCKSCSFWADNFDGIDVHLRHRDVTFLAISRAPFAMIEAYRRRMGWRFKWLSSFATDFNADYGVSLAPEQIATGSALRNYARLAPTDSAAAGEHAGISVFLRDADGAVLHTYSCYARGLDMLNGAYHYLDLTPKGRDEAGLAHTQAWVRRHDEYQE